MRLALPPAGMSAQLLRLVELRHQEGELLNSLGACGAISADDVVAVHEEPFRRRRRVANFLAATPLTAKHKVVPIAHFRPSSWKPGQSRARKLVSAIEPDLECHRSSSLAGSLPLFRWGSTQDG